MIDLEKDPIQKKTRSSNVLRAVFVVKDESSPSEPVNIAVPAKTVQFVNHMMLSSQMDLSEIEELPKRLLREDAGRAFYLQTSVGFLSDSDFCIFIIYGYTFVYGCYILTPFIFLG